MNFNLDEYNKVEAKEMGEFENLALGGHEIIIKDAREYTSDFSGNTSLKVCVDIAGNDKQKGFFQKQFENSTQENKKWSTSATKYLSLKDESLGFLKGFITACEKSNPNFKFNTKGKWEQLNGLKLAGQFGIEEYLDNDNNVKTSTKLMQFRSLDKLLEIKIPKVKTLNNGFVEYNEYIKCENNLNNSINNDEIIISNDDLPF
jgi:hypothetical protein